MMESIQAAQDKLPMTYFEMSPALLSWLKIEAGQKELSEFKIELETQRGPAGVEADLSTAAKVYQP